MTKPNRGLDPTVHKTKRGRPARVRPSKHFELPVQRDIKKIAATLRAKVENREPVENIDYCRCRFCEAPNFQGDVPTSGRSWRPVSGRQWQCWQCSGWNG